MIPKQFLALHLLEHIYSFGGPLSSLGEVSLSNLIYLAAFDLLSSALPSRLKRLHIPSRYTVYWFSLAGYSKSHPNNHSLHNFDPTPGAISSSSRIVYQPSSLRSQVGAQYCSCWLLLNIPYHSIAKLSFCAVTCCQPTPRKGRWLRSGCGGRLLLSGGLQSLRHD